MMNDKYYNRHFKCSLLQWGREERDCWNGKEKKKKKKKKNGKLWSLEMRDEFFLCVVAAHFIKKGSKSSRKYTNEYYSYIHSCFFLFFSEI